MGNKAIVIGAGFGGLAASLRLRNKGYDVTVLDRLEQAGGRATAYQRNGFVFDAGPTIITAPFLFEELFDLFGERMDDSVELKKLDPWYRVRFDDGRSFDFHDSLEDTVDEIARFSPEDAQNYRRFIDETGDIYRVGFEELGDQPFHSIGTMLSLIPKMVRLRSHESVYKRTSRFFKDEHIRQAFSFHPLLVGGNPFSTTSIYSLIHYLERQGGVLFAMGGTGALVEALCGLMQRQGITLSLGETVEEIDVRDGRACGVRLAGGEYLPADVVVANADAPAVYRNLIAPEKRSKWTNRRLERLKYSMGLYVLYFGTRQQYDNVEHHEILLGPRYRGLIQDIFDRGRITDDFSLYLHRPTRTDSTLAPDGCDSMYALVPVPNLQTEHDWKVEGARLRDRVVERLDKTVCPGLGSSICEDFWVTPTHFRDELLSHHGAGFSLQPVLTQSAYFRFHNRSEDVRGLYLVGAGTHPGAGLPGVVTSAKVLDRLVPEVQTSSSLSFNSASSERPPLPRAERRVLAARSQSFDLAAKLFSADLRPKVNTLYSFCRLVDDAADSGSPDERVARLQELSAQLEEGRSDVPEVQSFLDLAEKCSIDLTAARDLIDGTLSDQRQVRFDSLASLESYCYRVAGTVGLMMCDLMDVRDPRGRAYAVDLGIGMQLTNIARDIGEDFDDDRIYMPSALIDPEVLQLALEEPEGIEATDLHAACTTLLHTASRFYRSADQGMAFLPWRERGAVLAGSRCYEQLGREMLERGSGYWQERVRLPRDKKARIVLSSEMAALCDPKMRSLAKNFRPSLFSAGDGLPRVA